MSGYPNLTEDKLNSCDNTHELAMHEDEVLENAEFLIEYRPCADVAQLVEQLIRNQ